MNVLAPELALFQKPPIDVSIENTEYINFYPKAATNGSSILEFNIPGSSNRYIDLSKTRLWIKLKIVKADGTAIKFDIEKDAETNEYKVKAGSDVVCLTNLGLSGLFRQIDVALNQQILSPDVATCQYYKALMDILINNENMNESQLQSELFFAGPQDERARSMNPLENESVRKRMEATLNSKEVILQGPIHSDLCQMRRAIIPGINISFKFYQNIDSFRLQSPGSEKYKVEITQAALKVCHLKVHPKIVIAHAETLQHGNIIMPYFKSSIRSYW